MSKKNNRHAKQRRLQHLVLQEKAEEKRRQDRSQRKKALKDITQLLDSVDIASPDVPPKKTQAEPPAEKPKSTIYKKIRSLLSGSRRPAADEMETDGPGARSNSSTSQGLFSGVRTLKAIKKKKVSSASKLGGTGIAKGSARASVKPNKPKVPKKEELRRGLVSPKAVPSRLKNIVRRVNKRRRKGAVVVSAMKP